MESQHHSLMSSHGSGTIASSHKRQRLVLQPPRENDAPPDALSLEDLMVEILSRLPVQTLLQIRCVCKSWKSLISSSYFVKNHLHRSSTDPNLRLHRLLGRESGGFRLSRSLRSLFDNPPSSSQPIFDDLAFDLRPNNLIVGSCNGLICWVDPYRYHNDHYVRYLNPLTRLQSDSPCFRHPWRDDFCFIMFGFGYDHHSDTYKTVAIYCDPHAENIENKTMVKVYALGEDTSWRKMQSFPFFPYYSSNDCDHCGKFVSGTLNWLAARPNGSLVVVSVDIAKETCGEVLLPHVVDQYEVVENPKLWALGDCLCFSHVVNDSECVLWQMKVYGATESWTILLSISHRDVGIHHHFHFHPRPFFMLDNGEVLLKIKNSGVFILYNPRHKSFKYLKLRSYMIWFEGTTHIESLVSPCRTLVN